MSALSGATASGIFIMSTVPVCLVKGTQDAHVIDDIPGYCETIASRVWEHKHIVRKSGAVRKLVGKSLPLLPLSPFYLTLLSWLACFFRKAFFYSLQKFD